MRFMTLALFLLSTPSSCGRQFISWHMETQRGQIEVQPYAWSTKHDSDIRGRWGPMSGASLQEPIVKVSRSRKAVPKGRVFLGMVKTMLSKHQMAPL